MTIHHAVDMPPSEPPVFEIPPEVIVMENEPIIVPIAAIIPSTSEAENVSDTEGLEIYVDNVPMGASFNRGTRDGDRWVFTPEEFGRVELDLPPDFSGTVELEITAEANGVSRHRSLDINVQVPITTTTVISRVTTTSSTGEGTESTDGEGTESTDEEETNSTMPRITRESPKTDEQPAGNILLSFCSLFFFWFYVVLLF